MLAVVGWPRRAGSKSIDHSTADCRNTYPVAPQTGVVRRDLRAGVSDSDDLGLLRLFGPLPNRRATGDLSRGQDHPVWVPAGVGVGGVARAADSAAAECAGAAARGGVQRGRSRRELVRVPFLPARHARYLPMRRRRFATGWPCWASTRCGNTSCSACSIRCSTRCWKNTSGVGLRLVSCAGCCGSGRPSSWRRWPSWATTSSYSANSSRTCRGWRGCSRRPWRVGGVFWSWLYDRTGSLLGPWLSHLMIDAGIFWVGYELIGDSLTAGVH